MRHRSGLKRVNLYRPTCGSQVGTEGADGLAQLAELGAEAAGRVNQLPVVGRLPGLLKGRGVVEGGAGQGVVQGGCHVGRAGVGCRGLGRAD